MVPGRPNMPATLNYFMLPEDELQLFRFLEPRGLVVYPELSDPGEVPAPLGPALQPTLEASAYYLAIESAGPVVGRTLKRGPDKGRLQVDELASPVFHYERSLINDRQELVGGRIWAELDVVREVTGPRSKPSVMRVVFEQFDRYFHKCYRRSEPKGYWIGPKAAAAYKSGGLVLREPGHKGRLYGVWR
jgi:hypothetical protein